MFSKTKPADAKHDTAYGDTKTASIEPTRSLPGASRQSSSVIGSSTQVHGDINSDEDLTIEGQVTGTVTCKQHTVTLGSDSSLHGDAYAHTLRVSGTVEGHLVALHKTTVHAGANVTGTITTPCLVLEDGSLFQGNIDMNPDNDIFTSVFTSQQPANMPSRTSRDHKRPAEDEITAHAHDAQTSEADAEDSH
ncbi:polymer-forming cytoskeletal protein [Halomonas sp. CUBES01]|uniref:bactofilin family protein n=1 Tax=Halomonas sp. CUBES01 TaxID=2897340 RepID=UPI001E647662|nr:polymer-forming cytoskeletal protein [Halomonas sp. CUBES01]MEC4767834.1 polymer-forming cytoskeletal protein [Halomonas sp. CUBES01]